MRGGLRCKRRRRAHSLLLPVSRCAARALGFCQRSGRRGAAAENSDREAPRTHTLSATSCHHHRMRSRQTRGGAMRMRQYTSQADPPLPLLLFFLRVQNGVHTRAWNGLPRLLKNGQPCGVTCSRGHVRMRALLSMMHAVRLRNLKTTTGDDDDDKLYCRCGASTWQPAHVMAAAPHPGMSMCVRHRGLRFATKRTAATLGDN